MLVSKYKYLDSSVINYINNTIKNYPNFSEERFQLWIELNEIQSKNNPSAFINKCFNKELQKGTFDKQQEPHIDYVPATVPLFNYMRKLGIKVTQQSTGDVDTVCSYLLNRNILTPEELADLNFEIIEHLSKNKLTTSSDDFVGMMKQSNKLQKVNWQEVDKLIEDNRAEWNEILKQFVREF